MSPITNGISKNVQKVPSARDLELTLSPGILIQLKSKRVQIHYLGDFDVADDEFLVEQCP